jgi:putative tricarboxylic transport membrane protein
MRRDVTGILFWMVIGILFCLGSLQHGFQSSPGVPGSGFVPLLAGLVLVCLSLLLLVSTYLKRRSLVAPPEPILPGKEGLKRILQVLTALCFYVLALERLGFLLTALCFMLIVLRLEPRSWRFIIPVALVSAGFFYVLFRTLLGVPLPQGIVGF